MICGSFTPQYLLRNPFNRTLTPESTYKSHAIYRWQEAATTHGISDTASFKIIRVRFLMRRTWCTKRALVGKLLDVDSSRAQILRVLFFTRIRSNSWYQALWLSIITALNRCELEKQEPHIRFHFSSPSSDSNRCREDVPSRSLMILVLRAHSPTWNRSLNHSMFVHYKLWVDDPICHLIWNAFTC